VAGLLVSLVPTNRETEPEIEPTRRWDKIERPLFLPQPKLLPQPVPMTERVGGGRS
jgi:hypothetical protein